MAYSSTSFSRLCSSILLRAQIERIALFFMILFTFAASDPQWIGWVCARSCCRLACSRSAGACAARRQQLSSANCLPPHAPPPARAQLTMTILLALVILIDYMFLTESDFLFDPSVSNFMRKNAPA